MQKAAAPTGTAASRPAGAISDVCPQNKRLAGARQALWRRTLAAITAYRPTMTSRISVLLNLIQGFVTVLVASVIIWAAFRHKDPLPFLAADQDKLEHLAGFSCLALVAFWRRPAASSTLLMLLFAACAVELVQGQLPGRTASMSDALASVGGIVLGWLVAASFSALPAAWRAFRPAKAAPPCSTAPQDSSGP